MARPPFFVPYRPFLRSFLEARTDAKDDGFFAGAFTSLSPLMTGSVERCLSALAALLWR